MVVLSKDELNALGISIIDAKYGSYYSIPCAICGAPVTSRTFSAKRAYKCKVCKDDLAKKRQAVVKAAKDEAEQFFADKMGVDQKHYHRFEKAAAKFSERYFGNIETARKAIDKYDSIPEVIACIELLHIGTRVIVHQKVGNYTVDFCLPDEKLVVEIDGSLYHSDEAKEFMRDRIVTSALGDGWAVKHIPADAVTKNHALFGRGMKKMLNARREELRAKRL